MIALVGIVVAQQRERGHDGGENVALEDSRAEEVVNGSDIYLRPRRVSGDTHVSRDAGG